MEIYAHWGEIIEDFEHEGARPSKEFILAVWKLSPCEWVYVVECDHYTPGRPAVMYLRNGDPGYPAEGPEIELSEDADTLAEQTIREIMTRIPYRWVIPQTVTDWNDINLLDKALEKFFTAAIEVVENDYLEQFSESDDDGGLADHLYDQMKDRQIEEEFEREAS